MKIKFIFVPLLAVLFYSCSSYDKLLKSEDYNLQMAKANEYYEQGRWFRAGELYSRILPVMKSTKSYEDLFFRYCYTLYNLKDYLTASYQFKTFVETFPQSPKSEEASYMYAVALYKDSPNASLDPTNTIKAREALANFIYSHPASPRLTEALQYAQECTKKLEDKDVNSAKLYYNMGQYKAAKVAYQQLITKFPDSKATDFYQLMAIKSNYYYAQKSDAKKQEERFAQTIDVYNQMKDNFPESSHIKEAEKYYTLANKNINQIRNEHK